MTPERLRLDEARAWLRRAEGDLRAAWYATLGWMQLAFTLAIALWAFRHALGGRKIWTGDVLEG